MQWAKEPRLWRSTPAPDRFWRQDPTKTAFLKAPYLINMWCGIDSVLNPQACSIPAYSLFFLQVTFLLTFAWWWSIDIKNVKIAHHKLGSSLVPQYGRSFTRSNPTSQMVEHGNNFKVLNDSLGKRRKSWPSFSRKFLRKCPVWKFIFRTFFHFVLLNFDARPNLAQMNKRKMLSKTEIKINKSYEISHLCWCSTF